MQVASPRPAAAIMIPLAKRCHAAATPHNHLASPGQAACGVCYCPGACFAPQDLRLLASSCKSSSCAQHATALGPALWLAGTQALRQAPKSGAHHSIAPLARHTSQPS
jgi:hypothetical protein